MLKPVPLQITDVSTVSPSGARRICLPTDLHIHRHSPACTPHKAEDSPWIQDSFAGTERSFANGILRTAPQSYTTSHLRDTVRKYFKIRSLVVLVQKIYHG